MKENWQWAEDLHLHLHFLYVSDDNFLFEGGYSIQISSSKEMVNSFPMSMF